MGWDPVELSKKESLILSTQGSLRAPKGALLTLGYHTGHWEAGLLAQATAEKLKLSGVILFAGFVSDHCDRR